MCSWSWISCLDFSYLLRGHDSPSESCCVLVNSLLCVLVCACYYVGVCAYTLSSRLLPFGWLCAMALGPSNKLVGYWSNSSSSLILQYRSSLLLSSLLCHCVLVEPPVSLVAMVLLFCVLLLLSSFLCFCDLLLWCCTRIPCTVWYPDLGPSFGCPFLFWSRPASSVVLYQYLCCTNIFLGLLIFRLLLSYYWVFWNL